MSQIRLEVEGANVFRWNGLGGAVRCLKDALLLWDEASVGATATYGFCRSYGAYANRVRSSTPRCGDSAESQGEDEPSPPQRSLRKRWAELIYRIYEVDPLTCRRCGAQMKIVAFIIEPAVIRRILAHLKHEASRQRARSDATRSL